MKKKRLSIIILIAMLAWLFSGCAGSAGPAPVGQGAEVSEGGGLQSLAASEPEGEYEGVPVGFTEEGFAYLGDPAAPVTLEEYSDFLCPYCGRHFSQTMPALLEEYIRDGQVKYVFRDMPLVGLHPTAPAGHVAARCAAEQGAELFWAMHDQLFLNQGGWNQIFDPAEYLAGMAESLGVDMTAYQACMEKGEQEAFVQASTEAGRQLGFNGTPSFQVLSSGSEQVYRLVGALPVSTFAGYIEPLLVGEQPAEPEQAEAGEEQAAELPYWASAAGLQPDPERPGYTLAGDTYKGSPDAEVVVVEFADFQCPACAQHALEIQPLLDERLLESGQVMWVFKHYPLGSHAQAALAAVASECAAEQGAFWEMHQLLFENQEAWAQAEAEPIFDEYARQLGLEEAQYAACMAGRAALERVLADLYAGQGVVSTTPNFVVIAEGRGRLLEGSRPADQFAGLLESILAEAASP